MWMASLPLLSVRKVLNPLPTLKRLRGAHAALENVAINSAHRQARRSLPSVKHFEGEQRECVLDEEDKPPPLTSSS